MKLLRHFYKQEKEKKTQKIVLLARTKHNNIENLISKSKEISQNQFVRVLIN